jgi:hypothetical protein
MKTPSTDAEASISCRERSLRLKHTSFGQCDYAHPRYFCTGAIPLFLDLTWVESWNIENPDILVWERIKRPDSQVWGWNILLSVNAITHILDISVLGIFIVLFLLAIKRDLIANRKRTMKIPSTEISRMCVIALTERSMFQVLGGMYIKT